MTHHLVGMAEIAEMLGVSRQRVGQIIESYEDFPKPEAELTGGRIWSRTAVETWIHTHPDRGPGRPEAKTRKGLLGRASGRLAGAGLFTKFTDRARVSVVKAQEEARLLKHNYIGTEHLLLGLLATGEGVAHDVLRAAGLTLETARDQVRTMTGEGPETPKGHIPFTPRAKKALELALREALDLGHNYIGTEHVLLGLIRESEGVAWHAIRDLGLDANELRDAAIAATAAGAPTRGYVGKRISPAVEEQIGGAIRERFARTTDPVPSASPDTCAFCGKSSEEVRTLVAGPGPLRICDECVAGAMEVVGEAVGSPALETRLSELESRIQALEDEESS